MTIMGALATLAGSVGLYPLFSSGPWFWSGFGAVLSVVAGGLLVRRFRTPAFLSALGGLAALHIYLTVRFAAGEAWLGFVPTPSSLRRLGDLFGEGWEAANQYAAPVPLVPGIALLATAGIGLVAVAVDLLAARLRRVAPAGLPLLAMYSVPAAVREESINFVAFGIGAMGYLALLVADSRERVVGWGRVVLTRRWTEEVPLAGAVGGAGSGQGPGAGSRGGRRERPDSSALAASGRRIGTAAVAIAVLLPMAVPGIRPHGMFGMGAGGGRGGGTQTVTTPEPLVSLKRELTRQDDSVVLTYRTDDERPDYLRLYALDRYEGDRWTYSALESSARDRITDGPLPGPPGLSEAATRQVKTTVRVQRRVRNMTFLPVPYAPSRLSIEGDWRVDASSLMIYSLRDSASGRSYEVTSTRAEPTAEQLANGQTYPSEIVTPYTRVPRSIPPQIRELAQDVTEGATTAHEQAVRLQRWFTTDGGFQYDLGAPPPQHGNDLVDFLERSKRGYCEQYAAAMALLARILGIPARVAMGYTAGTQTAPGQWVVRSRDAHAWPELYFPGTGWVRFEPTPVGAAGQGTASTPAYTDPATGGDGSATEEQEAPSPEESPTAERSAAPEATERRQPQDQGPAGAPAEEEDGGGVPKGWLAAALLVLMILAAPVTARALARRRRWAAVVPREEGPGLGGLRPGTRRSEGGPLVGGAVDGAVGGGSLPADPVDAAHAAWQEMRADALDHGLTWRASDTPRAAARRLGELLELDAESAGALGRIARAEELARYSRTHAQTPAESLRADLKTVREAFAAAVGRRARLRARYLPPSSMATFRSAGSRALEATSRFSRVTARLEELTDRLSALIRARRG
ncbi:transglutaminase TgpA family protein [Spirillospora sp. CA-255316]